MTDASSTISFKRLIVSFLNFIVLGSLAAIVALAVARIARIENSSFVLQAESVSFYIFALGYPAFLFAVFARRRITMVVAAFVVLCHVFWVLPEFTAGRPVPDDVASAPQLHLLSHNVKFDNENIDAMTESIRTSTADIVFIQELSWDVLEALRDDDALAAYAYQDVRPAGAKGLGMFSKYPLLDAQLIASAGFPTQRAAIDLNGQRITLYNVHIQSPVVGVTSSWQRDLAQLRDELHAETGPTVAAGDYNATYGHRPFRALLENGWHEAHMDHSKAWARSWPMDRFGGAEYNGYIRLDHVLTSNGIQATHIDETPPYGSDHRGIVAHLAVVSK